MSRSTARMASMARWRSSGDSSSMTARIPAIRRSTNTWPLLVAMPGAGLPPAPQLYSRLLWNAVMLTAAVLDLGGGGGS